MKKLLLLTCILTLTSCSITFSKKFNPDFQPQTDNSMTHFLDSSKVIYNKADIATLKDTVALKKFAKKNAFTIPDAFFFNKEGYLVENDFKGTSCGHAINNADKINAAPADKTEYINEWVSDFNFQENADTDNNDYDATIIITWGMYAHKSAPTVNREAFEWYKSLKENYPDMKIRTILLNLDFQRKWFIKDEEENP
ncbi:hypothetical protein [Flavobacterium sp. NRK1]|uniref:hypothetical protein n=1 Tax=Flavobacterium sp. NRK1 TaxID=2954929 RepID=UPI0020927033|nr:hypothetical protein [Flavobacterium sp. NRK1]MCO6148215.1 hypothetical protein [Flavobacterium sp. NRK1]